MRHTYTTLCDMTCRFPYRGSPRTRIFSERLGASDAPPQRVRKAAELQKKTQTQQQLKRQGTRRHANHCKTSFRVWKTWRSYCNQSGSWWFQHQKGHRTPELSRRVSLPTQGREDFDQHEMPECSDFQAPVHCPCGALASSLQHPYAQMWGAQHPLTSC